MAAIIRKRSGDNFVTECLRAIRGPFLVAISFSFFINLLLFVSPIFMLQIYDRVIPSRNESTLVGLTVLAGVLLLVYACLEMLRSRILVRAGLMFDEKMAVPVFNAVHRGTLRQPNSGHVQSLRDIDSVREFLTGSGLISFCDMPWIPVFVFAAFVLHPWFGWIAVVGTVIILSLSVLNDYVTRQQLGDASRAGSMAAQSAQAIFRNSEVLQAMGMLGALRSRWNVLHGTVLRLQSLASDRAGGIVAFTKFFRMFLQTSILGVGAYLAIHREISPGSMIAASILIGRALQPVEQAVAQWKGFVAAQGAIKRLKALFEVAGAEVERMPLPRPNGALTLENVSSAAPGQRELILKGVTFSQGPGEILAIVGPSAAGKSSLARVLVGVWPVLGGSVRFAGSDLSHWNPQELGRYIGYLPQDVELFSGTVAQNISRFQDVDETAVIEAAELAGCHEMIQHLPQGYNTPIGDGGQSLSGGQRQRIGLARAVYGRPSNVILDEPNSNLDSVGEEALLRTLQRLKALGISTTIITHKLNILTVVDKIAVMNGGALQSFGPREEIMSRLAGPKAVPVSGGPVAIAARA